MPDLQSAIARFGANAKATLANPAVTGEPEEQIRNPLVNLFGELAEQCGFRLALITNGRRRHLAGKEAVSALAEEFGLQPSQIHTWVNQLLAQADKVFERSTENSRAEQARNRRIEQLEAKLSSSWTVASLTA